MTRLMTASGPSVDSARPGMLCVRLLRCPYSAAKIEASRIADAKRIDGVVDVVLDGTGRKSWRSGHAGWIAAISTDALDAAEQALHVQLRRSNETGKIPASDENWSEHENRAEISLDVYRAPTCYPGIVQADWNGSEATVTRPTPHDAEQCADLADLDSISELAARLAGQHGRPVRVEDARMWRDSPLLTTDALRSRAELTRSGGSPASLRLWSCMTQPADSNALDWEPLVGVAAFECKYADAKGQSPGDRAFCRALDAIAADAVVARGARGDEKRDDDPIAFRAGRMRSPAIRALLNAIREPIADDKPDGAPPNGTRARGAALCAYREQARRYAAFSIAGVTADRDTRVLHVDRVVLAFGGEGTMDTARRLRSAAMRGVELALARRVLADETSGLLLRFDHSRIETLGRLRLDLVAVPDASELSPTPAAWEVAFAVAGAILEAVSRMTKQDVSALPIDPLVAPASKLEGGAP
jgi:hypothetical protein